jgi:hypothetical protein
MVATYDDANVLLQVMRWGTEMGLEEAEAYLFSEDFNPETEPMDSPQVRKVLYWGEAVAALVKHGVLDKGLLLDIMWADGLWSRVGHHALAARAHENEPSLYENFEALVAP